jgi:hypothetical protein
VGIVVVGDVDVVVGSADDWDCWVYKDDILESMLGTNDIGCTWSRTDECVGNDMDCPPGTIACGIP